MFNISGLNRQRHETSKVHEEINDHKQTPKQKKKTKTNKHEELLAIILEQKLLLHVSA